MNALASGASPQLNEEDDGFASTSSATETINLGSRARIVSLPDGMAIEVKDSGGVWRREVAYTE